MIIWYGIEDFHPHKLRHSNASISITNGSDIASASKRLGHADKSTTLRMYPMLMRNPSRETETFSATQSMLSLYNKTPGGKNPLGFFMPFSKK